MTSAGRIRFPPARTMWRIASAIGPRSAATAASRRPSNSASSPRIGSKSIWVWLAAGLAASAFRPTLGHRVRRLAEGSARSIWEAEDIRRPPSPNPAPAARKASPRASKSRKAP